MQYKKQYQYKVLKTTHVILGLTTGFTLGTIMDYLSKIPNSAVLTDINIGVDDGSVDLTFIEEQPDKGD